MVLEAQSSQRKSELPVQWKFVVSTVGVLNLSGSKLSWPLELEVMGTGSKQSPWVGH